eukprot:scaffold589_cov343-Prasinococcus_capsulatus_cf.AAC.9
MQGADAKTRPLSARAPLPAASRPRTLFAPSSAATAAATAAAAAAVAKKQKEAAAAAAAASATAVATAAAASRPSAARLSPARKRRGLPPPPQQQQQRAWPPRCLRRPPPAADAPGRRRRGAHAWPASPPRGRKAEGEACGRRRCAPSAGTRPRTGPCSVPLRGRRCGTRQLSRRAPRARADPASCRCCLPTPSPNPLEAAPLRPPVEAMMEGDAVVHVAEEAPGAAGFDPLQHHLDEPQQHHQVMLGAAPPPPVSAPPLSSAGSGSKHGLNINVNGGGSGGGARPRGRGRGRGGGRPRTSSSYSAQVSSSGRWAGPRTLRGAALTNLSCVHMCNRATDRCSCRAPRGATRTSCPRVPCHTRG